jgi:quinol monooxygenase YgiN
VEKMMTLRVVARIKAKTDKIEQVREALVGLVAPTRSEPGCITYQLLQNRDDPTDFTFVEEWDSDSALGSHAASDHIKTTRTKLKKIVEEAPDIRTYGVIK